jgi:hypothetical protein
MNKSKVKNITPLLAIHYFCDRLIQMQISFFYHLATLPKLMKRSGSWHRIKWELLIIPQVLYYFMPDSEYCCHQYFKKYKLLDISHALSKITSLVFFVHTIKNLSLQQIIPKCQIIWQKETKKNKSHFICTSDKHRVCIDTKWNEILKYNMRPVRIYLIYSRNLIPK